MSNIVSLAGYVRTREDARASPGPDRTITRHDISRVLFEPQLIEADAQGRVLSASVSHGCVFLYIEESVEPKKRVRLAFEGYRAFGDRIPPEAVFITSVFEHGDAVHIYLKAGAYVES